MAQTDWTPDQREAAREFIGEVMPNNPAILVNNIEAFMPAQFRRGFEKLFAKLGERKRERSSLAGTEI